MQYLVDNPRSTAIFWRKTEEEWVDGKVNDWEEGEETVVRM